MKKVIVISIAILLVLSGAAVTVLYYIGDRMVDLMLDSQLDAILEESHSPGLDAVKPANPTEQTNSTNETKPAPVNPAQPDAANSQEISETASSNPGEQNTASVGENAASSNSSRTGSTIKTGNSTRTPVKNPAEQEIISTEPAGQEHEEKIQYTVETINKIKDKVTAQDKISAAALLIKRLTPADIEELQSMLSGGVSAAEKERAKEIVYQRFSAEEIKTIKEMYKKYMKE